MAAASDLPILLDGDTGYGNFNNLRRLVRQLEQRGIAGVCIEDKQFPKTNSLLNGDRQPLADIEEFAGKIAAGVSVEEISRLQDADEYAAAERQYLAAAGREGSAVVLAATRGRGLETLTADRPKVMLPIAGKPLLRWLIDGLKKHRINDITVVGGYRADAIDPSGIKLAVNERYFETDELASLACAVDALESDTVISYGDIIFRSYVPHDLVERDADFAVVVDSLGSAPGDNTVRDLAYCSRADDRGFFGTEVFLERVTSEADPDGAVNGDGSPAGAPQGQWIGLLKVRSRGLALFKTVFAQSIARVRIDGQRGRRRSTDRGSGCRGRPPRRAWAGPITMMQNSGLGNAVSLLTSLTWTFRLPQLLIVTWRGQPGVPDEPQHALVGPITPALLETMEIPWELFPTDADALGVVLERAVAYMDANGQPYALLMQKECCPGVSFVIARRSALLRAVERTEILFRISTMGNLTSRDIDRLLGCFARLPG